MVPRVKMSKGCCVPRSASNPSWEPGGSRSFTKVGINIPSVHTGHGVGPCQEFSCRQVGTFHFRVPRAKQGGSHCTRMGSVANLSPSSQHPLPAPLPALCFSRRGWKGSWGHCSPGFCARRVCLAYAGLRPPQVWGYLPSSLRPGKRTGLRRVTSLANGSGSSVTAATTVPACVGMLTIPKLGPPAQDLVRTVLPTATRHAGGRVVDFKLKCLSEELIGAMVVFKDS